MKPRRGDLDVIVVGGGVMGSAAALALARDGLHVALIEARQPKPWSVEDAPDLRVVALAPDAIELLDELGAWPTIIAVRASPYRYMRVWDALAPGELTFDAAEEGEAALGAIVENRLIQYALWQAFDDHPGSSADEPEAEQSRSTGAVRLICPAHVVTVDNSQDGVTATLDDGTRLRAQVLIAAEGANSSVRKQLGIDFIGRDYHQRALVAHVTTGRPHENTAWQRFLPGGPLAFLPLSDGRCSVVWSLPEDDATRILALDDDAFRAELGCAFDFRLGQITDTTARAAFPLRLRLAQRYGAGRCVLLGDTAHLVHPLAGQGMNLGLRDVRRLQRVMREARRRNTDLGARHILRRYERERRSESLLAARTFDMIERVFAPGFTPIAALRGAGLAIVNRTAPLRHLFGSAAAGRF